MYIKTITLNNFRCFTNKSFDVDGKFVVVKGKNGSGKTSLLEAIHYSCYLRSFRTHLNRDLISLSNKHFFIKINFDLAEGEGEQVQVGYSEQDGKLVKLNQKPVQSYKELLASYRIFTLTADDLQLVSGAPEKRREFLNYSLALQDPDFLQHMRRYKQILQQRNNLLMRGNSLPVVEELQVWTKTLWEQARKIQEKRKEYLTYLEKSVNTSLSDHFHLLSKDDEQIKISFEYKAKNKSDTATFDDFTQRLETLTEQEFRFSRSLFGAHLDDFVMIFQDKKARVYASRGQQKLLVFLIKIAQLKQTLQGRNPGVLLLDDFLTDFDHEKIKLCLTMLKNLNCQIFISCPTETQNFLGILSQTETFSIDL